jgi:hypothetical protein
LKVEPPLPEAAGPLNNGYAEALTTSHNFSYTALINNGAVVEYGGIICMHHPFDILSLPAEKGGVIKMVGPLEFSIEGLMDCVFFHLVSQASPLLTAARDVLHHRHVKRGY